MLVIEELAVFKKKIKEIKKKGFSIGFVPTMGFLHEGHLALMKTAKRENDVLVISIFVNPLQFGVGEDYVEYPRDLERDKTMAASVGCDLIFSPSAKEMYPFGYATFVDVGNLTAGLCGAARPGHFRGVTTVVTKLFNLACPDRAYFGQKDAQQALVLKKMILDLNMDLELKILPTVREPDGLAMSSRNKYLTLEDRKQALVIPHSLLAAEKAIKSGERAAKTIKQLMFAVISQAKNAHVDYIEIVDTQELRPLSRLEGECLLAVAVKFQKTRLIDNIILEV